LKRRQVLWQKKFDSDVAYLVGQYDDLAKIDIEVELLAHKDLAVWTTRKQQQDAYTALVGRQTAWKQKQHKDIGELELTFNNLSHIDITAELQAHVDLTAYTQRAKDIADVEKLIARCVADEAKEQKVIDKLRTEIDELKNHKCYACGQDFHDANHETVLTTKEKALQEAALQALSTNGQWLENTDALSALYEQYIRCNTVIAHNIEFDSNMIRIELSRNERYIKRYNRELFNLLSIGFEKSNNITRYCTMANSVDLCNIIVSAKDKRGIPYTYKKYPKLSELHEKLFASIPENLHDSLIDTNVCLKCYLQLVM
jgi:hypothetical protein